MTKSVPAVDKNDGTGPDAASSQRRLNGSLGFVMLTRHFAARLGRLKGGPGVTRCNELTDWRGTLMDVRGRAERGR